MNLRRHRAHLLTLVALLLAFPALRSADRTRYDDVAGVRLELPARIGDWRGESIRYCAGASCGKSWRLSELEGATNCPTCNARLDAMAAFERAMLPADTTVVRSLYDAPGGREAGVTIVLSGRERASIHRPEVCLSGPGNEITGARTVTIPIPGRAPLSVRLLTARYTAPGGAVSYSYFAYWFVARDRETSSHVQRLFWMSADRILHGVTRRWAYISIAGTMRPGSDDYVEELKTFAAGLAPQLMPDQE